MASSESPPGVSCNCKLYPDNPGGRGWGGRYYDSGIRQLGVLVVRGRWGYIILFADPQGVALLQEVINLTFVPDLWLIS